MTKLLHGVLSLIVRTLDFVVRKDPHSASIFAWEGFADMGLPIVDRLTAKSFKLTWLVRRGDVVPFQLRLYPGVTVRSIHHVAGMWAYVRARYVFFTHGLYAASVYWMPPPPESKTVVNMWHGMPIKAIGSAYRRRLVPKAAFGVATSPYFQEIMASVWKMPPERILVSGLPWADRLLGTVADRRLELRRQFGNPRTLVLWLPTWRIAKDGSRDGINYGNIFGMPRLPDIEFAEKLAEWNVVLVVKPHPFSANHQRPQWNHDCLHYIDDSWLESNGTTLYELLSISDALVSDVSSVIVDYVLLDRPIIHAMGDIDEYEASRGLTVGRFASAQVGPLARSYEELLGQIEAVVQGCDPYSDTRRQKLAVWHRYTDGRNAERLLEAIGISDA